MTKEERILKNQEFLEKLDERVRYEVKVVEAPYDLIEIGIVSSLDNHLSIVYNNIYEGLDIDLFEFIGELLERNNDPIPIKQLHSVKRILERCEGQYLRKQAERVQINTNKENESILQEAERITTNSRKEQYGNVEQSFSTYKNILKSTFNIELTEIEIVKVLMAIKLGREQYQHKRDNLVDLCGYAKLLQQLEDINQNKVSNSNNNVN